jgi:hypothetical protein
METAPNEYITESAIVFSKAIMEELEILCRNYFNPKTLTPDMVLDALSSEEPENEIWLVRKYHEKLTDLGIPVQ